MLVRCDHNLKADLPFDLLDKICEGSKDYNVKIGQHYTVYAMVLCDNYMWYFLNETVNVYHPSAFPSPLFTVVNGCLSKYWRFSFEQGRSKDTQSVWIAYPEWINDPYHYESLFEKEEDDVKIFQAYKAKMDIEFPDPTVKLSASILDDNWLMCPICIDGWESRSTDGMVICPKCHTVMHNPRYTEVTYPE